MANLPHGDQRKLEVALLMALEPQVFMFDEPTAGMNAAEAPVILDLIRQLKADKTKTILLVEHKMDVVRELADRIIVLHNGTLVADGEPAEVIASPIVQEAYLGQSPQAASSANDAPHLPAFPRPGEGEAAMSDNLLTLDGVHTHIGAYHILHGVDLAVPRGQLTMLLGRNGAGKTTTLRTIMGLWHASQGRIALRRPGHHAAADAADRRAGHRLRAREHGHLRRPDGARRTCCWPRAAPSTPAQIDEARLKWIFSLFPAVEKFWNHPAGKLSGGQKQMLAVSRAIVEPRELLIVDEPSKGLAPAIINNMIDAFAQLKASGVTILLVEQNINFAKRLGDTVAVMDNGVVVHAGSMKELADDEELQHRCWGWRYEPQGLRLEAAGAGAGAGAARAALHRLAARPGSRSPSPAWRWA